MHRERLLIKKQVQNLKCTLPMEIISVRAVSQECMTKWPVGAAMSLSRLYSSVHHIHLMRRHHINFPRPLATAIISSPLSRQRTSAGRIAQIKNVASTNKKTHRKALAPSAGEAAPLAAALLVSLAPHNIIMRAARGFARREY
jgi:hypothetical protein